MDKKLITGKVDLVEKKRQLLMMLLQKKLI